MPLERKLQNQIMCSYSISAEHFIRLLQNQMTLGTYMCIRKYVWEPSESRKYFDTDSTEFDLLQLSLWVYVSTEFVKRLFDSWGMRKNEQGINIRMWSTESWKNGFLGQETNAWSIHLFLFFCCWTFNKVNALNLFHFPFLEILSMFVGLSPSVMYGLQTLLEIFM